MRGGIDDCDLGPHQTVYVVLLIPAGRLDVPAREILLRAQVGLGERGPAEGDARFLADNGDRVPEPLLPQGHGGIAPGHAAADDHDSGLAGILRHLMHVPASGRRETRGWSGADYPDSGVLELTLLALGQAAVGDQRVNLVKLAVPEKAGYSDLGVVGEQHGVLGD